MNLKEAQLLIPASKVVLHDARSVYFLKMSKFNISVQTFSHVGEFVILGSLTLPCMNYGILSPNSFAQVFLFHYRQKILIGS